MQGRSCASVRIAPILLAALSVLGAGAQEADPFAECEKGFAAAPADRLSAACSKLKSGDPADELIAATSIVHGVPLLTRDRQIRRSKLVPLA